MYEKFKITYREIVSLDDNNEIIESRFNDRKIATGYIFTYVLWFEQGIDKLKSVVLCN